MHDGATPEIFNNASRLRLNITAAVKALCGKLKCNPLGLKFRRQHPINYYILDFYCHKKRFSKEIDGVYHDTAEQQEKDQLRTEYLNSVGIKEVRFKNEKVINNLALVLEEIYEALRAGSL